MTKKITITIIIAIAATLGLLAVTNKQPDQKPVQNKVAQQVSPQEFARLAKNPKAFVLDVHTPEQTHIPGTTAYIPYDQITQNQDKLPVDKNTPILVYCRSGNMSAQAAKTLASLGYVNIYDLEGGTNAYKESNVTVSLTPTTKSLGTVIYGDVTRTTYLLTNYTPLPLKITRVSGSCGCTKPTVDKTELGPYESIPVNVSFDPAVHKDDTDLGNLTRTIYIETDNPNFPELESTFTATVIKKN